MLVIWFCVSDRVKGWLFSEQVWQTSLIFIYLYFSLFILYYIRESTTSGLQVDWESTTSGLDFLGVCVYLLRGWWNLFLTDFGGLILLSQI